MSTPWKNGDEATARRVYSEGLLTFASVCLLAIGISVALAVPGWMGDALRLPPGGTAVMVMTVICTAVFTVIGALISRIFCELAVVQFKIHEALQDIRTQTARQ